MNENKNLHPSLIALAWVTYFRGGLGSPRVNKQGLSKLDNVESSVIKGEFML